MIGGLLLAIGIALALGLRSSASVLWPWLDIALITGLIIAGMRFLKRISNSNSNVHSPSNTVPDGPACYGMVTDQIQRLLCRQFLRLPDGAPALVLQWNHRFSPMTFMMICFTPIIGVAFPKEINCMMTCISC